MAMLAFGIVLGAALVLAAVIALRLIRFRDVRVATCPEARDTVALRLDSWRATVGSIVGKSRLRVRSCTHWPERDACAQRCLAEVERAPDDCRVAVVLRQWYADKSCALCGKPVSPIGVATHKPALLDDGGETKDWAAIRPEKVHEVLATHRPVCWDCHVIESLYRQHRDLVVERPAEASRKLLIH